MNDMFDAQFNGPLYRPTEFRELRAPLIEPPRRNYTPRSGFVSLFGERPSTASLGLKPAPAPIDLTPSDLERGRRRILEKSEQARAATEAAAIAAAKAAIAAARPLAPLHRILELLRERAPEALSSRQIADALDIDVNQISSRLAMAKKSGEIETVSQPKTARRLFRWVGAQ